MAFWSIVEIHLGNVRENVKNALHQAGFDSFNSYQTIKTDEEFDKLFVEFESIGNNLNPGEKAEIKFLFGKLQSMTQSEFRASAKGFGEVIKEVEKKLIQNPSSINELREFLNPSQSKPLNTLLKNAEKTFISRSSTGNRYAENLIKLCIFIYCQGGASLFESLSLIATIPGIDDVRKSMYKMYQYVNAEGFYINELKKYLLDKKASLKIGICYDDTRIRKDIVYDSHSSSLVGLKAPLDKNTCMPVSNTFRIQKPTDVIKCVEENAPALFMHAIIAVSFDDGVAPYPIAIFPTNTDLNSEDFEKRIHFLSQQLFNAGFNVSFIASNGAPPQIGGQKRNMKFGERFDFLDYSFPFNFMHNDPCFQDIIHLLNKLKIRLFDDLNTLWIGNKIAAGCHLLILVKSSISKMLHKLSLSDVLNSDMTKDKMSFKSTEKILQQCVINALENIAASEGTRIYLSLMQNIYEGFLSFKISTADRISKVFYVISFLRRWRKFVKKHPNFNAENFITTNAWHSIEINAGFILRMALKGEGQFLPICGSQAAESFFRNLRSISSSGLTKINFNFYEVQNMVNKINVMESVRIELEKEGIKLKEEKVKNTSNEKPSMEPPLTNEECKKLIMEASKKAAVDTLRFGIEENDEIEMEYFPKTTSRTEKQEIIKYNEIFYATQEFEYENTLTFEVTRYNSIKIGGECFLDTESENHKFRMVDAKSPKGYTEIPISRFLWYMLEKDEKITNDRLMRFQVNDKKEWQSIPMAPHEVILARDHITTGDTVIIQHLNEFRIGQVFKFQKIVPAASKKREKRFRFTTLFFNENSDVAFFLWPIAKVLPQSLTIEVGRGEYFKKANYIGTINPAYVDLKNLLLHYYCRNRFNF